MTDPIARVEAVLVAERSGSASSRILAQPRADLLREQTYREALAVVRAAGEYVDWTKGDAMDGDGAPRWDRLAAALSAFTERVQSALGEEGP